VTQLQQLLPEGWAASLLAVDGHCTEDVARQLARLPAATTHLVLSVGGNDALAHTELLDQPATSTAEVLALFAGVQRDFEVRYRKLITTLARRDLPLLTCTIYNGNFPDQQYQRLASTALCLFNDVILRVAFEWALPVIDLRSVCDDPADYANPIEPSASGGAKIARAIAGAIGVADSIAGSSRIVLG
jgi:lysophospholipase L1-like esterase